MATVGDQRTLNSTYDYCLIDELDINISSSTSSYSPIRPRSSYPVRLVSLVVDICRQKLNVCAKRYTINNKIMGIGHAAARAASCRQSKLSSRITTPDAPPRNQPPTSSCNLDSYITIVRSKCYYAMLVRGLKIDLILTSLRSRGLCDCVVNCYTNNMI